MKATHLHDLFTASTHWEVDNCFLVCIGRAVVGDGVGGGVGAGDGGMGGMTPTASQAAATLAA
jgi:hypothetical protein